MINRNVINLFIGLIMISLLLFSLFPIYWMLGTSIKQNTEAYKMPPDLIPKNITLEGFSRLFTKDAVVLKFFINSFVIGIGTVIICLFCALLAGYSLSRIRIKQKRLLMVFILVSQMFPLALLAVPLYIYYVRLGLLNTYIGVILLHTAVALPLCIWLLKGFYDSIPIELEEVARLDGCSKIMILIKILFPLVAPGIITVAVFSFLVSWREFLLGLIFTSTESVRPLSPGIAVYYLGFASLRWRDVMAASILTTAPVLIIYILLQKYVISGLTGGAVKG